MLVGMYKLPEFGKSVWGEVVNQRYIKDVKITPHLYEHTVEIEGLVEDACLLSVETKQSKCPLFANVKVKYQNIDVDRGSSDSSRRKI